MDEQRIPHQNKNNSFNSGNGIPFYSSDLSSKLNFNRNRFNTTNNLNNNLDEDTEQEAINMIRTQNRRIQDLSNELELKDTTIQNLQFQINSFENYKIQHENYKRQVSILEEKNRLYESEFSSKSTFMSDQLKHISEAESKLRNQIVNKDKMLHDLDSLIKDLERQISGYKKQLLDKDGLYQELKQDFNEISVKFKNLSLKLNAKEEDYRKTKENLEIKTSDLNREKNLLEEKLTQLIDIVKQYSKELSEYSVQVQALETEKRSIQKLNNRLQEEIEDNRRIIENMQNDLKTFNNLQSNLTEAENMINRLENLVENEKIKYDNLFHANEEITHKYNLIKDKYSGENSLENLKNTIGSLELELGRANQNLEGIFKTNKSNESKMMQMENELKETNNGLNQEIKSIIQWMETYLVVFYDPHFEIPDLPLTTSKVIKNKFKLDVLKEKLGICRAEINQEFNKYENIIKDLKKEINENMHKQEKFHREISDLKNQILDKNENIFSLTTELDTYRNSLNHNKEDLNRIKNDVNLKQDQNNRFLEKIHQTIQKEIEEIIQIEKFKGLHDIVYRFGIHSENIKSQVEDSVDKLISILSLILKEVQSYDDKNCELLNIKSENENLKREISDLARNYKNQIDNLNREKEETQRNFERIQLDDYRTTEINFKQTIDKLKLRLNEKEELNSQLVQENNLLKSQCDLMHKNISINKPDLELKENLDKLTENCKSLEKKIRNLTTEMDLKEMQIKNQEQMISRRTQEINELKSKTFNNITDNIDKEKYKALEIDKNKLLKDNLALMNSNFVLTNQINLLKGQAEQIKNKSYHTSIE